MATEEQYLSIKCPHCGWVRKIPVSVIEDESWGEAAKGVISDIKKSISEALSHPTANPSSYWIDIKPCPHCQKPYQYNIQTREIRP